MSQEKNKIKFSKMPKKSYDGKKVDISQHQDEFGVMPDIKELMKKNWADEVKKTQTKAILFHFPQIKAGDITETPTGIQVDTQCGVTEKQITDFLAELKFEKPKINEQQK